MGGMNFQYDEDGGTFYYFITSFLVLILIPCTFAFWPRKTDDDDADKLVRQCHCDGCQSKRQKLRKKKPWEDTKKRMIKLVLIVGWLVVIALAYKTSTIEIDHTEYDPYQILQIDRGASVTEIKKAYRRLSLIHHPDRGGEHKAFMLITKAHAALTDEETRKNVEEYGNPDGPGVTKFGIALPKWLVEQENSMLVLAAYGLALIVILPLVVGTWWYRSIKFSADQVLMDTTQLYLFFFHKTPNMVLKRAIMILGASCEFFTFHNKEVIERPTDNEEIPVLMKELSNVNEKSKEQPLCYPYSVKARTLLHAHLTRLALPPNSLDIDKDYILRKCPLLINEMINTTATLTAMVNGKRLSPSRLPRLETVENVMRLSPMLVQAQWDSKSPFLQLPHITENVLRHFHNKKRTVRTLQQFAGMSDEERRSVLRTLSDAEYRDVVSVLGSLPIVAMECETTVKDEEDDTITVGSLVTVSVMLQRRAASSLFKDGSAGDLAHHAAPVLDDEDLEAEPEEVNCVENEGEKVDEKKKPKVWEKQKKQKKKGKAVGKAAQLKKKQAAAKASPKPAAAAAEEGAEQNASPANVKDRPSGDDGASDSEASASDDDDDKPQATSSAAATKEKKEESGSGDESDTEQEWFKEFQRETKKDSALETRAKVSHRVHCPYFPVEKQEFWWLYVCDRRKHELLSNPIQICNLKEMEQVNVKFPAPPRPGTYQYTVCLRSDSYCDLDVQKTIKLEVKAERVVTHHKQWDISDDEEENRDGDDDTDEDSDVTDYSDSEDASE